MEKKGPSNIMGGNVNRYNHYGGQYGDIFKTWNRSTIWSSFPTPKPWENMILMSLFTKRSKTHRLRKQTYGSKEEAFRAGMDKMGVWGWHIHTTIMYLKLIISKDLLYSIGNSTQYSVINGKREKRYEKHKRSVL